MTSTQPAALDATLECLWPLEAELGEGPVWSAAEQAVWFVDIKRRAVHRYHVPTGGKQSWPAPAEPGFIVPVRGGGWICGLATGLYRFDPVRGEFSLLREVEPQRPGNRLNDAFVDADGHLWFGSMDNAEAEASGALYQLTDRGCLRRDAGYVITNGPAASPDGRTLYHTDTLAKVIYAFDRDAGGTLANKRVFATIAADGGYPDGPCVDHEGCVWTGLFGGWGLNRYAADGRLLQTLRLPCANVTKAAFGDEDLRTLYITTARKGLDAAQRAARPLSGGLFRVRVPVAGLPQGTVAHGL